MIDDIRIQMLIEQMSFAQDSTLKTYDKFLEILSAIVDLSSNINGYPGKTVEMLEDINIRIDNLEQTVCNILTFVESKQENKIVLSFWNYLIVFFIIVFGSMLGMFLYSLLPI